MESKEKDPIVIVNDPDEDVLMNCEEDDLEVIPEQTVEFIDFDNPIQYTDEQVLTQLLNILSFQDNDVFEHRSFWDRRSKEFLTTLKATTKSTTTNPKVLPIIDANKVVVVPEEDDPDSLEAIDDALAKLINEKTVNTTDKQLLKKRFMMTNRNEPYKNIVQKLARQEVAWETAVETNQPSSSIATRDTEAYIGYVAPFDPEKRLTRLIGPLGTYYEGDQVVVVGCFYGTIGTDAPVVRLNWPQYASRLYSLVVGSSVDVCEDPAPEPKRGTVVSITDTEVVIDVGGTTVVVERNVSGASTVSRWVYPVGVPDEQRFWKHRLLTHNVALSGLRDIRQSALVVPTVAEVLVYNTDALKKTVLAAKDVEPLLRRYGLSLSGMTETARPVLQGVLKENVASFKVPKRAVSKSFRKEFKTRYGILDFAEVEDALAVYTGYASKNKMCDTDYNRIKFVHAHGDDGLFFYATLLNRYADQVYRYVEKHKPVIDKELAKLARTLEDAKHVVAKEADADCPGATPSAKKEYASIDLLYKDNYREVEGVKEGDYAKLLVEFNAKVSRDNYANGHSNTLTTDKPSHAYTLYKRVHFTDDKGKLLRVWVKDRVVPYQACASTDSGVPAGRDVKSQPCVYDAVETICTNKRQLQQRNHVAACRTKKDVLSKMIFLYDNYARLKSAIHAFLDSTHARTSTRPAYLPEPPKFNASKDYSKYVGDVYNDNEMMAEQGVQYRALGRGANDDEDDVADDVLDEKETSLAEKVFTMFGVVMPPNVVAKIQQRSKEFLRSILPADPKTKRFYKTKEEWTAALIESEILRTKKKRAEVTKSVVEYVDNIVRRETVYVMCAMFVIFVQMQLPDIKVAGGNPQCKMGFQGYPMDDSGNSLLSYVSCVLKNTSVANDELLGIFAKRPGVPGIPKDKIETAIKGWIEKILKQSPLYKEGIQEASERIKGDKTKKDAMVLDEIWDSFRPVLRLDERGNDDTVVRYVKGLYEVSKQVSMLKLEPNASIFGEYRKHEAFTKLQKDVDRLVSILRTQKNGAYGYFQQTHRERVAGLFSQRPITLGNTHAIDSPKEIVASTFGYDEASQKAFEKLVREGDGVRDGEQADDTDAFWEDFSSGLLEKLDAYATEYATDEACMDDLRKIMFSEPDEQQLNLRNVLGHVLRDDARIFLSRTINRRRTDDAWIRKLPQLKRHETQRLSEASGKDASDVVKTMDEIARRPDLLRRLKSVVASVSLRLGKLRLPSTLPDTLSATKRSVYIYDHVLIDVLHKLRSVVDDGDDGDGPDGMAGKKDESDLVRAFCGHLLRHLVSKIKESIFDADYIAKNNEKLREKRKEDIIGKFQKLDKEDHAAFKTARNLGLVQDDKMAVTNEEGAANDRDAPGASSGLEDGETNAGQPKNDEQREYEMTYEGQDADYDDDDMGDNDVWTAAE